VGDYNVIADVSSIIRDTLTEALVGLVSPNEPQLEAILHDLSDTVPTSPPKLTVFLYEIAEDAASRNRPPLRTEPTGRADPVVLRKPPMALLLRYLITAWGGDQITQHQMLGRAMRALYDDAILDGTRLTGGLAGSPDALHVTLTPLTLDQKSYVWFALQKPYRLSLNYEVRVVNLESTVDIKAQPVLSRALVTGAGVGVAANGVRRAAR
jgi:Pvc16 N-terminal domain